MRTKQIIISLVVLLFFFCGNPQIAQSQSKLQSSLTNQWKTKASTPSSQNEAPSSQIPSFQNIEPPSYEWRTQPFSNQSGSKLQRHLTEQWKIKANKPLSQEETPSPQIPPIQFIRPPSYEWRPSLSGSHIFYPCIYKDCYHIYSNGYGNISEVSTYTQETNLKDNLEGSKNIEITLYHDIEVRETPSYCSAVIETLEKGEKVIINENELKKPHDKTWLKLEAPSGWVSYDDFLTDGNEICTITIRLRETTCIRSGPGKRHSIKQILLKDRTICFSEQELTEAIDELRPSMDNVDEIWLALIQPEGWISYKDYIKNHLR
ncbi:MAG: hypothetical protein ACMUIU_19605 [bacterium]